MSAGGGEDNLKLEIVMHHLHGSIQSMERIVHKARSFKAAESWTLQQYRGMTADERIAAARELQRRFYGPNSPDVRESCRKATR